MFKARFGDSSMVTVHYYKMKSGINDKRKLQALSNTIAFWGTEKSL